MEGQILKRTCAYIIHSYYMLTCDNILLGRSSNTLEHVPQEATARGQPFTSLWTIHGGHQRFAAWPLLSTSQTWRLVVPIWSEAQGKMGRNMGFFSDGFSQFCGNIPRESWCKNLQIPISAAAVCVKSCLKVKVHPAQWLLRDGSAGRRLHASAPEDESCKERTRRRKDQWVKLVKSVKPKTWQKLIFYTPQKTVGAAD